MSLTLEGRRRVDLKHSAHDRVESEHLRSNMDMDMDMDGMGDTEIRLER